MTASATNGDDESPIARGITPWISVAAITVVIGMVAFLWPDDPSETQRTVSVSVALVEDETVVYLEEHGVFVVFFDDEAFALDDDAKHGENETVVACRPGRYFVDWRHGAKWDLAGRYLAGPGFADLDRYPVSQVDNDYVVALSDRQVRSERSPSTAATEPLLCPDVVDRPGFAPEPLDGGRGS